MDSTLTVSNALTSTLTVTHTLTSSLVSRGLRYDPLRTISGELMYSLDGELLMSVTATYRSVLTEDSFITTTT